MVSVNVALVLILSAIVHVFTKYGYSSILRLNLNESTRTLTAVTSVSPTVELLGSVAINNRTVRSCSDTYWMLYVMKKFM